MAGEGTRYRGIERTLRLVADLLKGRRHDRRTAAALLDVAEPAAFRQLTAIAKNLPGMVWDTSVSPQALAFDRTKLSNPPEFPAAVAACFGLSLAPLFDGAHQESGMRQAFEYVLGESRRRKVFQDIDRKFTFVRRGGEIALPQRSKELDDLIDDVVHSRTVKMTYRHFGGEVENVTVRPLSLCIYDHQLYLVAESDDRGRYPFRFSRIEAIDEADGEAFVYPPKAEYDAEQLFADSFGVFVNQRIAVENVVVRLAPRWATHARSHRWHLSQRVEILASGEVIVRLCVRVCPELKAWIRSFGPDAVVVEPTELREAIAADFRAAVSKYAIG